MTDSPLLNATTRSQAEAHQAKLTKPPGSLGRLEELAIQLAAYQGQIHPQTRPCSALLFAADHPANRHDISPYPSAVTAKMLNNFREGGAAASILCRLANIPLIVIDAGVEGGPVAAAIQAGDIRTEDALSHEAFERCLEIGRDAVLENAPQDRILILGEMGIGNTTIAAAVAAALLQVDDPGVIVGLGTGADARVLQNKIDVVREAVARLGQETTPSEILRRVGGRELVALYGAMKQGIEQGSLLLIDGFIVTAVAAVIAAEDEDSLNAMVFSHRSSEQGHRAVLAHLHARPLLDLGMRLGEATGALMALPLLDRACALHNEMATFESAGIPGAVR